MIVRAAATRFALALLVVGLLASCASHEPFRDVNGTSHEPFRDLNGAVHDPLDVRGVVAHVLIFVTTDCPIANGYAPEIRAIAREHADNPLRFYLIHVDPDITPEIADKHSREYGVTMPVLLDPRHRLVREVGATITPEVAVLSPGGGMPYRGRIDDLYSDLGHKRRAPRTRDLRNALAAVLFGKPVRVARTTAIGCDIPDRR